jgi:Icc-related predicted phosphoesterase
MGDILKITLISDTHTRHNKLNDLLPGGDVLIHAGDVTSVGNFTETLDFIKWLDKIDNYNQKIFIAGNHDYLFQERATQTLEMLLDHKSITYLQDSKTFLGVEKNIKVWGSPWQPEFNSWAFNLKRGSDEIKEKWAQIPKDTDLLITHGPPFGRLDWVTKDYKNVGSLELAKRIEIVKPKIHVFGHVHEGYGYTHDGHTHYINASMTNHQNVDNKPISIIWDVDKNEIKFL